MADILGYLTEQILNRRVGLLVLLIVALTLIAAPTAVAMLLLERLLIVSLTVTGLRVWDDLADLAHDRIHHPARILARTSDQGPFVIFGAILLAAAGGFVLWGMAWVNVIVFAVLVSSLALIYAGLHRSTLRHALVLGKYPAILLVVTPLDRVVATPGRLVFAMVLAWLATALHDLLEGSRKEGQAA